MTASPFWGCHHSSGTIPWATDVWICHLYVSGESLAYESTPKSRPWRWRSPRRTPKKPRWKVKPCSLPRFLWRVQLWGVQSWAQPLFKYWIDDISRQVTALLTQGSKAGFRDTLEGVTLIIPNSGEIAEAEECSAQPVLCGAWDGITMESFPGGKAAWAALSSRSSFQFFPTPLSSLFQGDLSWAHLGQMFGPGTIFQGFAAKLPFHVIHFFKAKHEMVLVRARAD